MDPEYLDKNYGGILIIWDRMFGTFQPETFRPHYGPTKPVNTFNIWSLETHEYVAIAGMSAPPRAGGTSSATSSVRPVGNRPSRSLRQARQAEIMDVSETRLPGVGLRYEFENRDGQRIAVIARRGGDFEVFLCAQPDDPDSAQRVFRLNEHEADALAQILGRQGWSRLRRPHQGSAGTQCRPDHVDRRPADDGRPLGDTGRTRTGASIVAIVRGALLASPDPGDPAGGDVLVVIGTDDGIGAVRQLVDQGLSSGCFGALLLELGAIHYRTHRAGFGRGATGSPIPLYLLTGLFLGNGGLAPVDAAAEFVETGAIGVVLLLLTLGLEFSVGSSPESLRRHLPLGRSRSRPQRGSGALAGWLLGLGGRHRRPRGHHLHLLVPA